MLLADLMPQNLIPFRTYVAAAALSLLVNVGAVGTFATFRFGAARGGTLDGSTQSPTLVLSELTPLTEEKTKDQPSTEEKPPAEEKTQTQPPESKPPPAEPTPIPKEEEIETKLGNPDAPDTNTKTWIGVSKDSGTPQGVRGTIDQGEFKPGLPGSPREKPMPAEPTAATPAPTAAPPPSPKATPVESKATESETTPRATTESTKAEHDNDLREVAREQPMVDPVPPTDTKNAQPGDKNEEAIPSTPDPFEATLNAAKEATTILANQFRLAMDRMSNSTPETRASRDSTETATSPLVSPSRNTTPADAARPATQSAPRPPTPSTRTGENGNGADRESDAFSKTRPVDVRPGQPLAGKGLAVKTVAPQWTTATRVLFRFRNPVIRVKFGRNGKVIHAAYLPGQDAGHPDISGPLLDAVYRWKAQGDELNTIPADDPQAGLTVTFHIILN